MEWRLGRPLAGITGLVALVGVAVVALQGTLAAIALVDGAIVLAAAVATGAAAWRIRWSPQPRAWRLMSAGLALFTVAEAYWSWTSVVERVELPAVSVADAVYYAGYGCILGALVALFPHQATIRARLRRLVDVLVLTAVLVAIVWIAVLRDAQAAYGGSTWDGVVAIGYPALDVALAAILLVLGRDTEGLARRRMALLGAGFLLWMVGDLAYAFQVVVGDFASGFPLDVAWFAGYLLFIVGAATGGRNAAAHALRRPRAGVALYLVYLPIAVLLPLAAFDFADRRSIDPFLFGLGLSMMGLLTLRQGLLTQDLVTSNEELRASEERMSSLLDNLDEAYVSTDLLTGTSTTSAAIAKVFGRPRAVFEADPMAWSQQVHAEDAARVSARYAELTAGTPTVDEHRIVRPDGAVRWIRATMHPVKDSLGQVVRIDGVLRDVTSERESRQHEEEVKRLQELTLFKTQFLNNAAHELATPLTPLKLQVASLRRSIFGKLDPRQEEAVGLLERNLHRLGLLVGDLLDAARLQGGHLKLAAKPVRLEPIVADVLDSFTETARKEGILLGSRHPPGPVTVTGDATRLNQVLFNLVHNALKFTPAGGRVDVSLEVDGDEAVLRVTDSGVGLSAAQMAVLFQPFTQVHDLERNNSGGTGLGLYISKGIVEQHGGRIGCRSEGPGKGCEFEVRLPLAKDLPAFPASSGPNPGPRA